MNLRVFSVIFDNHRTIDAAQISAWLDRGIGVMDLADVKGIDRRQAGYDGIAW